MFVVSFHGQDRREQNTGVLSNQETSISNRPGVAGAVLQTPSSFINSVSSPFPPNLQDITNPMPLELRPNFKLYLASTTKSQHFITKKKKNTVEPNIR